jgi:hypothetical protein
VYVQNLDFLTINNLTNNLTLIAKFAFELRVKNHKEGSNQRLKRDEAIDRNQDKKAMAADI